MADKNMIDEGEILLGTWRRPDIIKDIALMHHKFGFTRANFNGEFLKFRIQFLEEELEELNKAVIDNDPENAVDALIDLIVVAVGTLDIAEVDISHAWRQVHKANMEKQLGSQSKRPGSSGYDLVKPEGWVPPNHHGNIGHFLVAVNQLHKERAETSMEGHPENHKGDDEQYINDFYSDNTLGLLELETLQLGDSAPESVKVLLEAIKLQLKKSHDYQNPNSPVQQADYYPNGIMSIFEMVHTKYTRIKSLVYKMLVSNLDDGFQYFESLEDSMIDCINYLSFGVSWLRGKMQGQKNGSLDFFNRPIRKEK